MKSEELIKENLIQKIGGLFAGFNTEKIKEHIRMLDWVLNDGFVRNIDDIVKDYSKRNGDKQ